MQPSGCPGQGFRKEKCHSPFRISKCYWLGQPVKVKQNFWNLYSSAVNIDKGCLKTLKWTVKSLGYMIWLKLIKELGEKQYFLEWHEHPVNILIFHTIRWLPNNAGNSLKPRAHTGFVWQCPQRSCCASKKIGQWYTWFTLAFLPSEMVPKFSVQRREWWIDKPRPALRRKK